MRSVLLKTLLIAAVAGAAVSVNAFAAGKTYYVDPNGNDTADGAEQHPWLTLQHAADVITQDAVSSGLTNSAGRPVVPASETVIVHAGTYAGFVMNWDTAVSGSASATIAFLAEPGALINSKNGKTADGIDLEPGCDYVTISGFTVNNAGTITRAGIRITENNHATIRKNVCLNNGTWGILTSHSDNLLVENNETAFSQSQHGIYVSNACVNPVVRGNISHDNANCGLHFNGDLSQGGTGIITGALVENNVIYNNGASGGAAINMDGVQNSIVRNNLMYNNHAAGITMFKIDAAEGPKNNVIYNNTIDMASNARWAVRLDQLTGTVTLRNNILYNRNTGRGGLDFTSSADVALTDSDYNIYGGGGPAVTPDDSTGWTLAQWQAQGKDTHSSTATAAALFVNGSGAAGADYHLAAGSPAIDAGQELAGFSVDKDNNVRPAGAGWDIGVYERGTGTASLVVGVNITPAQVTLGPGEQHSFVAAVTGSANTAVTWSVQETGGGTITSNGIYTAPSVAATFHVVATSVADAGKKATAVITINANTGTAAAGAVGINSGKIIVVGSSSRRGVINPDRGDTAKIFFKGSGIGRFEAKIFTMIGELVWEQTMNNVSEGMFEWAPKNVASGNYIVYIKGPGINTSQKIAVLR